MNIGIRTFLGIEQLSLGLRLEIESVLEVSPLPLTMIKTLLWFLIQKMYRKKYKILNDNSKQVDTHLKKDKI